MLGKEVKFEGVQELQDNLRVMFSKGQQITFKDFDDIMSYDITLEFLDDNIKSDKRKTKLVKINYNYPIQESRS